MADETYKELVERYANRFRDATTQEDLSSISQAVNRFMVGGKPASREAKLEFLSDVEAVLEKGAGKTYRGRIIKEADNKEYLRFVSLLRNQMTDPPKPTK